MSRKKAMRRLMSLSLCGLLGAGAITACAAGPESGEDGDDVVVQLVWNDGYIPQMDKIIAEFESANPGVTIEATYTSRRTTGELLSTQLPAGGGPDVFQTEPGWGPRSTIGYARGGNLRDLSDRPWADDVVAFSRPYVEADGALYALQLQVAIQGFIYSTEIYDELGLEVPGTFTDLLGVCDALGDAGYTPIAVPFSDFSVGANAIATIANSFVPAEWYDKRFAGDVSFSESAEWRTVLERLVEMNDHGCFGTDPAAAQNPQHVVDLAEGKAASAFLGSDAVGGLIHPIDPDFSWGIYAPPGDTAADTRATWYAGASLTVNNNSKTMEQTLAFVDFAAQPEQISAYAQGVGGVAPADAAVGDFSAVPQLESVGELFAEDQVSFLHSLNWPSGTADVLVRGVQGLFLGSETVDGVLAQMDAAWQ